uniref:Uncharacterized protein n=1 Tax=Siphoviridae sp. ctKcB20 TaxID=2827568 RepID=A0A8S5LLA1_9CAUD|nr:MAG TPA: hypothetical protein [Siphoviridae sp. ctKcB20]
MKAARVACGGVVTARLFGAYMSNRLVLCRYRHIDLTAAHYFTMEKCVNAYKSPTKNVMM